MIKRQFKPGFRIDLHRKDLNLALNAARELGLSLPNTASAMQSFMKSVTGKCTRLLANKSKSTA